MTGSSSLLRVWAAHFSLGNANEKRMQVFECWFDAPDVSPVADFSAELRACVENGERIGELNRFAIGASRALSNHFGFHVP